MNPWLEYVYRDKYRAKDEKSMSAFYEDRDHNIWQLDNKSNINDLSKYPRLISLIDFENRTAGSSIKIINIAIPTDYKIIDNPKSFLDRKESIYDIPESIHKPIKSNIEVVADKTIKSKNLVYRAKVKSNVETEQKISDIEFKEVESLLSDN
jgi:hypothetical protein